MVHDTGNTWNSGLRRVILLVAFLTPACFGLSSRLPSRSGRCRCSRRFRGRYRRLHPDRRAWLVYSESRSTRHDACRDPARAGTRDPVDSLGEVQCADRSRCPVTVDHGLGALAVKLTCAYMLARYRHLGGGLTRAAFLSPRNDALATLRSSVWPDLIVGLGIAALSLDAARKGWGAARNQHRGDEA